MLATIPSATLLGVAGQPVDVEVHVGNGLPAFNVVGLPDAPCREARARVRAAIASSSLPWPDRKITVNLAPSAVRKSGAGLDLAIAVGVLVAGGHVMPERVAGMAFLGELGLDGSVRRVPGIVPLVGAVWPRASAVVVPPGCATEASLLERGVVREVPSLAALVGVLLGEQEWPAHVEREPAAERADDPDLADVRGQPLARLALEVAAAGGHHLLLVGPPGAGKTMLARRLPGLLPDLTPDVALEATCVASAAGIRLPAGGLVHRPPFRSPHHSASAVSLLGGGQHLRPGEISAAHGGVLFLDELGEFPAHVLDSLRQPLEEGVIRIARAKAVVEHPARFQLVAAMNPCPCGTSIGCRCSDGERVRYARRISGPLLDRIDLRVDVPRPDIGHLLAGPPGESSAEVAERVHRARARAATRGVDRNADLAAADLDRCAPMQGSAALLLEDALRGGTLSARGLQRVRRVARTIADLRDGEETAVADEDVALAMQLRSEPSLLLPEAVA